MYVRVVLNVANGWKACVDVYDVVAHARVVKYGIVSSLLWEKPQSEWFLKRPRSRLFVGEYPASLMCVTAYRLVERTDGCLGGRGCAEIPVVSEAAEWRVKSAERDECALRPSERAADSTSAGPILPAGEDDPNSDTLLMQIKFHDGEAVEQAAGYLS
jgi:hypothetical protein